MASPKSGLTLLLHGASGTKHLQRERGRLAVVQLGRNSVSVPRLVLYACICAGC